MIQRRIIRKYPLQVTDSQTLRMFRVRHLLTVQKQNEIPTLWAIVNPRTESAEVEIVCFGTGNGHPDPEDIYLGTIQKDGFVWHYFERRNEP